jgi:hypothetical protein
MGRDASTAVACLVPLFQKNPRIYADEDSIESDGD